MRQRYLPENIWSRTHRHQHQIKVIHRFKASLPRKTGKLLPFVPNQFAMSLQAQNRLRGMLLMIFAVAILAVMDAALKQLGNHYSPLQVAAMRGMSSLPFILALLAHQKNFTQLIKVRWGWQILRGLISIATLYCFVYAFQRLNLADAYCIFFISPILIAALSAPLLGERLEWRGWLAIMLGLVGVIWMLRPSGSNWFNHGTIAALGATFGYVATSFIMRIVSRTDTTSASTFWFLIFVSLGAGLLALPDWRAPVSADWPWLLAIGLCGWLGQQAMSEAFRLAPPAVVAPFEYTALLWGVLLDYFIWGALPNTGLWGGASLVIASGLYMLWHEHRQHQVHRKSA